ncbi:hypothetical protein PAEPH01_0686 [Pancytospora epiphaga]|nr:hypothetical protein PAEPH01_0686 [Pancytospora epiphaga]
MSFKVNVVYYLSIVDYLATQCDRMLYHDYTCRHNEVVRCIHLRFKYVIYMYYRTCVHTLFKR